MSATPPPQRPNPLADLLRCPEDGGTFSGWDGQAPEAVLRCSVCERAFPVVDGLPRLLPENLNRPETDSDNAVADKRREIAARDAQVGAYDQMLGLRLFSIPEIPLTLRYLSLEPDHLMLEAGCGTGRMTPAFAARVRGLVCADFSLTSLQAARAKLSPELQARTLFVQADVSHLPLAGGTFDRVGSFQVLEHLPTHTMRQQAVGEMARALKGRREGGRWAFSAYRWGTPVSWLAAKQGYHDGNIPFFRATWPEFADLLRPHLAVRQHTGVLLYHYLAWGRKHL
jgi:SAM-dependent methyltransferase